ncbi:gamma-glutamyl-gamma-aminobutyrate hydrolase family protein [Pseudomonas sp. 148P]|uniref:Gamma-glutamyl-gamma-aminobutyrate hydrolase family protein n=1 Tax=Pseudomonas ulcerans TaxID=3115852 RepID=A0ABU7HZ14_9PSED|nr:MULTISPECIES: gamma-glutamyl-gamma-aminobutyrate hydrolase family protein [unclassified Pseudomonas]MEE1925398.1 gamma-glutamyl-gamma-aminobutyrate hydrolase family protein [Pseudomonas sp. 147P]MEE1936804.1 gamma-glutamyl-gamma-aminobutyrate hydrolase family protein [Pseudomonas sp. 148P]
MRIAITQRVEQIAGHGERRDCLDQRWAALLEGLGIDAVPVPNGLADPAAWLLRQGIEGLILSGGNDLAHLPAASNTAAERDSTETTLLSQAESRRLPVLAVCRGLQMLNHFLGGELVPLSGHAGCMHPVFPVGIDERFERYVEVNSFHNWGIAPGTLAPSLLARVRAADESIEAVTHEDLPWVGIMWHPERPSSNAAADSRLIRHLFSCKDQPCA